MLPFSRLETSVPKPIGKGYTEKPQTIGNHIRNKRLLLKLEQKDVAKQIGVIERVVSNWEVGSAQPNTASLAKIVRFLGYIPWALDTTTLGGKIEASRLLSGHSRKEVAAILNVNPMTVLRWETNVYKPSADTLLKLNRLYNSVIREPK